MNQQHNLVINIPTFSVEDLINTASPKQSEPLIVVEGMVKAIRPFSKNGEIKCYYGDLRSVFDSDYEVSFRCPPNAFPQAEGQIVKIQGPYKFRYDTYKKKFIIEVNGPCIGVNQSGIDIKKPLLPTDRNPKQTLRSFIENNKNLKGVLLIGTSVGCNDLLTSSGSNKNDFMGVETPNMTNVNAILTAIENYSNPKGIFIVRGGDDDSIFVWDDVESVRAITQLDVPFYTAIGHAHRITLLDQFSDESFLSPIDLGHVLKSVKYQIDDLKSLKRSLKKSNNDNICLQENSSKLLNRSKLLFKVCTALSFLAVFELYFLIL
ncbi:hypothetical protein [Pleionea mediterranea]|uniref:Exonuclease VII large subunit n=1 Tax=Pleionea mediterranea TaxID=523701 RepID=A0A316FVL1_9GAMM|nr:hypothetical protein [Pleionea mediterranea]PWK52824.1 exonuclease VII large subunit [Pleionea mediterranea]